MARIGTLMTLLIVATLVNLGIASRGHSEDASLGMRFPFTSVWKGRRDSRAYQKEAEFAKKVLPQFPTMRAHAIAECPSIATIYYRIFDNLLAANKLQAVGPYSQLGLYFSCLRGTSAWAEAKHGGFVRFGYQILALANSDDEIAIAIAHEIGHLLQGDPVAEYGFDPHDSEFGADEIGTKLVANAGYDPTALYDLGCKHAASRDSRFSWLPCWIIEGMASTDTDSHGTSAERLNHINAVMKAIGYQRPGQRTISPEFAAAKAEVACLEKRQPFNCQSPK